MDASVLRIIDANGNRAREALRVMEEYARFALNDTGLSSALKDLRHALAACVRRLGAGFQHGAAARTENGCGLVAYRDIVGDVGCDVRTASEFERPNIEAVVIAAGKRLSESLRVIEEYGKTLDPAFAARIERLRYRGYEIERRVHATLAARAKMARVRLYLLLSESLCRGDWFATAEAALRGGVDCLQLREKSLTDRELLRRAERLIQLCREHGALFIVNDRPDIATAVGADGVHLGQDDLSVEATRRVLPAAQIIGVSTHTIEQVGSASASAPDYLAVGPMFATPTKPQDHIVGPAMLAAARRRTSLPLVAIGGIDDRNAPSVLSAAPCALCVCHSVIAQHDPRAAAVRLRGIVDEAWRREGIEAPPVRTDISA